PCWYSKTEPRQRSSHTPTSQPFALTGIGLESSADISVRDRLHQLAHLVFQIVVGYNQRADGRTHITAAGHNRLVDGGFQAVIIRLLGLSIGGHPAVPVVSVKLT